MNIRESVAIVTGGSSGLGRATVEQVVKNGGKAAIFDVSEELGTELVNELGSENILFVKTNVVNEEEVQNAINQTVEKFGAIHLVVNCAGIGTPKKVLGRNGDVHDLEYFNKVIQINLVGTFNVIRLAAAKMTSNSPNEEGERGVIINTASVAAFEGQIGQAAYSASKNGIVGMTLPIARELARHGIRVMTIAPGLIETPLFNSLSEKARQSLGDMVPFPPRLGHPAEYAQLVESIVKNPLLNGETIRLDGAIRMQPK
ncbi:NAD(P)-dependent dehydrogenase, short-chain alcohol dehydrogenase family [Alteribacillus persepolensis]|uniref:NAD(P)-dependent dehydrogenase, short-chain alcohol dehydrogenase family n=1 Tax=Alteribacillus persepolensis TaxID=568899 RepID=A0A1G8JE00_9BACI|nr:3-hydroxyacyl-CoA dehydrogenase [Alteribacillus persepolensis]SDI29426.1 NAD(P)-dependent dehydrogenase, short-chain alcohol dehydrogenase family [Alteribacillus persepolensis]